MTYSLFECRDGTFVVVPKGFSPPIEVYNLHGDFHHVSDRCRYLYDSPVWDEVSRTIDLMLYAAVRPEVAFCIFDVEGAGEAAEPGAGTSDKPPSRLPKARASRPDAG